MKNCLLVLLLGYVAVSAFAQNATMRGKLDRPAQPGWYSLDTQNGTGKIIPNKGPIADLTPTYSLSALKVIIDSPEQVWLSDSGREGLYRYDPSDTTTPNNDVTVIVAGTKRYKLVEDGYISIRKFGVKFGSGLSSTQRTANTAALQAAANYGQNLFFPAGVIEVNGTITVTDKRVHWQGFGQASVIRQCADNDLFVIDQSVGNNETIIESLRLEANAVFTKATALVIKGYPNQPAQDFIYSKPFGVVNQLVIGGKDIYTRASGATAAWKKGIRVETPNVMQLTNITYQGYGSNVAGGIGLELVSARAAVETVIQNVKCLDVETGIRVYATNYPGIEGLRILGCTMSGVLDGITLENTVYGAPYFYIGAGTHIAAKRYNLKAIGVRQGKVDGCVFYNSGNSLPNDYAAYMLFEGCGDWSITNNSCYFQGGSESNNPYGILITGTPKTYGSGGPNYAVKMDAFNNYIVLKNNTDRSAIWYQNYCLNSQHGGNQRVGGNHTVRGGGSGVLMMYPNVPADIEDGITVADNTIWTLFDGTKPASGYKLDLTGIRSQYVIIPTMLSNPKGVIEIASLKQVLMRAGQRSIIQFDGAVKVENALEFIRLNENRSANMSNGESLELINTSQRVEEITRRQSISSEMQAKNVQSPSFQSGYIKNNNLSAPAINKDYPSGFYTVDGTAEMPKDPSGKNVWLLTVNRYEENAGTGQFWCEQIISSLFGIRFRRNHRADNNTWTVWTPIR